LFTGRDAEKRSHATGHCVIDIENRSASIIALSVILGELTLPVTKKGYENLISWA
jgi:hypothetical protein